MFNVLGTLVTLSPLFSRNGDNVECKDIGVDEVLLTVDSAVEPRL